MWQYAFVLFPALLASLPAQAGAWTGSVMQEMLVFANDALSLRQHAVYPALALETEYYHEWNGGRQSLTFLPFLRLDRHDRERTHADLRELTWLSAGDGFELRTGVRKVFWGVTESQHLVDVINQTDLVENPDGEDKLGQPMLNMAFIRDWGTFDVFVLPGFRERTFPGIEGRPRLGLPIETDDPIYESAAEERHIDSAVRWSQTLGNWDLGVSHFSGTGREPRLVPEFDTFGRPVLLRPRYDQIEQTGLDLQAALGGWLLKLEAINRSGQGDRFAALTTGFEYTFTGVLESASDVGILAEYLRDTRSGQFFTPFQKDLLIGMRWTPNDEASTQLLAGAIVDLEGAGWTYNVEFSRRVGERWKFGLEARGFNAIPTGDILHTLRNDDSLRLELTVYF